MLNSSVNSYRRLDPHFEAPNQIKASAIDRGSMVRIPIGNERSMRVEVRSVGPTPTLTWRSLDLQDRPGRETAEINNLRQAERFLPDNIYAAMDDFKSVADWAAKILGEDVKGRYVDLKQAAADRCPRDLGTFVKASEVQYHHEVYNQSLWNLF